MIKLILALTSISQQATAPTIDIHDWALQSYGPEISFNIKRNGNNIGSHVVSFKSNDEQLHIVATTKIRVKFLFFTAYKFDYTAREVWQNGELISLLSTTNDNGKKSKVNLDYDTDIVNVTSDDDSFSNTLNSSVYTTNHWNPNVLNANVVLNTVTGKLNQVQISQMGEETIPISGDERAAIHHRYAGDLNNISTWYDKKMRWVGLNFKGKDGSIISYECNLCGDE
jgi:Domain of unknown function (DUF6134)|tara:strand:- start:83550 stop:84227 length:678 start_codon:yes stop_codon:yes gene_type:complete